MSIMDLIGNLPVTLVVKAPNEKISDQTVECPLDWTIKDLKEHLSDVYPNKPNETEQRIIYSGRLLQDHLVLKDVLKRYEEDQTIHTVHLVCSDQGSDRNGSPDRVSIRRTNEVSGGVTVTGSGQQDLNMEGLRQRHVSSGTPHYEPHTQQYGMYPDLYYSANMAYSGVQGVMGYTPEQMMWLQQLYAHQVAAQYMQQQYYHPTPATTGHTVEQEVPVAAARGQQQPARQQPQQPQAVRMNAQGGAADDDDEEVEGGNRDWLDWVYTMSRFLVLLSIVYFYSTFSRFLMVFSLALIVYLYQAGWVRFQRQRAPAAREQQREVAEQPDQREDQQLPEQPSVAGEEEPEESDSEAGQGEQQTDVVPQRVSFLHVLSIFWTLVSGFFTSLVPDQPAPVNAN